MQKDKPYKNEAFNEAIKELKQYKSYLMAIAEANEKLKDFTASYEYIKSLRLLPSCSDEMYRRQIEKAEDQWVRLRIKLEETRRAREEKMEKINYKLSKLHENEKEILKLYYFRNYSLDKIAMKMYFSRATAARLKARALKNYIDIKLPIR